MGAPRLVLLASVLLLALPTQAADSREQAKLARATEVLERFTRIPEESIPPALLRGAYGVAVIPSVIKGGFLSAAAAARVSWSSARATASGATRRLSR